MKTPKTFNILFLLLILGCNTGPVFDINDDGDTIPPIITITYPADQSVLSDTVRLSVYAFDDRELDNVVIYIDSSAVLTEIDTPFTLTYDWITTDPNLEGVHTIWAIAEDIGGNINKTKPIQVTIDNYDDQNPEGLIIYPYSGQTLAGSVNILIEASDNEEVSKVTIHVNGDQIAEIMEEPYQFTWETNDLIDDIIYEIHAQVYDNSDNKTLLGRSEWVGLPSIGTYLKARVDSGANTSSLSASEITRFERDGEDWVRFKLALNEDDVVVEQIRDEWIEAPIERRVKIIQASGEESRPVISLLMTLGPIRENVEFTLNDRSHLDYPVLLGRRFMMDIATIDVAETYLHDRPEFPGGAPSEEAADDEAADQDDTEE